MFDIFQNQSGQTDLSPFLALMGGGFSAGSSLMAGDASAKLMGMNADISRMQATSALQSGAENAELYRQRLQQTLGKQAASIGGGNITTSGSALRSLETTSELGNRDIAQIQLNAARKAWGFDVTAAGDQFRSNMDKSQGTFGALGSLITSGARAYGDWSET